MVSGRGGVPPWHGQTVATIRPQQAGTKQVADSVLMMSLSKASLQRASSALSTPTVDRDLAAQGRVEERTRAATVDDAVV
jgi:hypothetical protein